MGSVLSLFWSNSIDDIHDTPLMADWEFAFKTGKNTPVGDGATAWERLTGDPSEALLPQGSLGLESKEDGRDPANAVATWKPNFPSSHMVLDEDLHGHCLNQVVRLPQKFPATRRTIAQLAFNLGQCERDGTNTFSTAFSDWVIE